VDGSKTTDYSVVTMGNYSLFFGLLLTISAVLADSVVSPVKYMC
jgi:hypothetical protein